MIKNIPLLIGLRYIRAKRRNHFISFISAVSMIGLVLGVMVLIIVMSVMNGFDREMQTRVLGMVPHGTISQTGGMSDWRSVMDKVAAAKDVEGVSPYIETQGLLSFESNTRGILIYGIAPETHRSVSIVGNHFIDGSLDDLKEGEFNIVLGEILARILGVGVGDKVTLMVPEVSVSIAGLTPRYKRFTVSGIFKVGAEMDSSLALINVFDAAKLLKMGNAVDGIRLKVDDLFKAREITWNIAMSLGGRYLVSDWTRTQGNLYKAIQMEKRMIALLLVMIVAVAAFNIVSSLVMLVQDKQGDIAILRTMGASQRQVMGVFMVQGTAIGLMGVAIGAVLGIIGALSIAEIIAGIEKLFHVKVLDGSVYFISYFPSELHLSDVLWITGLSFLLSFVATIYPSFRAARVSPAEALRYE
ncbi:lipoprotein-releasing ABC transporter permease subunit [Gynuella sunshinyii]|uniref:ABC-type transport system, involved in lipoprotein release, permease component n=1 Tax=Gynuella sunshinyii YC6258 TaxID=1445510 RepID=A0A0C5VZJ1_9GAMM|nr:lipoprotein-releasing ABC transporter permease subunit [Gynuella sunshinyii]AJQ95839.1 ABC-type transport system, involved in lipoprotein release, permease component [Gynuella sunshinyii YC6258]